ncbi:MAG: hypothetical protein ACE5PM_06040 [Candidatus Hydrothermarchaeales archaeon]
MKDKILSIINELKVATPEDLLLVLKDLDENPSKKALMNHLSSLKDSRKVFSIHEDEIEGGFDAYILGPEADVEEDLEIKRTLLEKEIFPRSLTMIDWEKVSRRILTDLIGEINTLKGDILRRYKDPKTLELNYFELSLRYHEFFNFFHRVYSADFLIPIHDLLRECRSLLDKLEFKDL